jgi:hypothetical protein
MRNVLLPVLCLVPLIGCVDSATSPSPRHSLPPVEIGPSRSVPSDAAAVAPVESTPGRGDAVMVQRATLQALQGNQPVSWRNPKTGHHGSVTPQPAYRTGGTYCREYQQTTLTGSQTREAYGRACRQKDGSWRTIS